jgi:hypothetical protein
MNNLIIKKLNKNEYYKWLEYITQSNLLKATQSLSRAFGLSPTNLHLLRTDDTNKQTKIDAWIDIYFLTYFHSKLYR